MIGLDTNALLRLYVDDDLGQSKRVRDRFREAEAEETSLFVNCVVLSEAVWVLKTHYRYTKTDLLAFVRSLLEISQIAIEDEECVGEALAAYEMGPADFSDYLIGERNQKIGCHHTLTFDRAAARHKNFEPL